MPPVHDYLLSYGKAGDFGRFYSTNSLSLRRGARAIIRSPRGIEFGTVLCPTNPSHATHLPNTTVGQLLRLASEQDEQNAQSMKARAGNIFSDGRDLAKDLDLHIELQDLSHIDEGCGRPNCGRGEGGCSSCGSNGGCGSCGSHGASELQA